MLALGWRGAGHPWERYEEAYLFGPPACATPLVLWVHTVVHDRDNSRLALGTIFPPDCRRSHLRRFAMVLTLAVPLRVLYHLEDFLTMRHLENIGKVMS